MTWAIILTKLSLSFSFRELGEDNPVLQEQSSLTKCSIYVLSPWVSLRVGDDWGRVKKRETEQIEKQELGCWSQS